MTPDLDSQLSTWTGARQTMSSWARVIESFEAVPEAFQSSTKTVLKAEALFPYTVFAPAMAGMRHKITEKLLCEMNDSLYVWERIGNQVALAEYPLETISDLETGYILLCSWITLSGVTKLGIVSSTTVVFNTATRRHFARFMNKIRPTPDHIDADEQSVERAKFDVLEQADFKFMNFARESLVGGEKVLCTIWQPKITKPILKLGWRTFSQTLALAHLVVLTDKELIVIEDDERSRENRGVRYGGKWRYIALEHIRAVSLLEQPAGLVNLSITLAPGGREIEIIFAAEHKQEVIHLQGEFEKLIGAQRVSELGIG